jgi:predicted alpha/beta superfamily hydrolase
MIKKLAFLIIILIFAGTEGMAQKYDFKSSEPQTVLKEVKRDNGQLYTVIITLPSDYNPEKEYKILYYLDAWWLKELVSGCYRIKSLSNKSLTNKMDELILVGVSSTGNEEDWNKQRNMDFTPSPYNQNLVFSWGSEQLSAETTGGAKEFLSFFEHDIINSIESEYKIDPASRGILGHSFGGLFGFYSYLTHSELFSNYILIAPSVWWNTSELLTNKESLISKRNVNMFIAMGTNEIKLMKEPVAVLVQELERDSNMNMLYKQYENEDHHSVLPQSIYDALEFLYTESN